MLGFRAAPFLARALGALKVDVAVALVRGHGFLHPRKFGVACHAGLVAGVPTCGVADSLLRVDGVDEAAVVSRGPARRCSSAKPCRSSAPRALCGARRSGRHRTKFPADVRVGRARRLAGDGRQTGRRVPTVPRPRARAARGARGRVALRERVVDIIVLLKCNQARVVQAQG